MYECVYLVCYQVRKKISDSSFATYHWNFAVYIWVMSCAGYALLYVWDFPAPRGCTGNYGILLRVKLSRCKAQQLFCSELFCAENPNEVPLRWPTQKNVSDPTPALQDAHPNMYRCQLSINFNTLICLFILFQPGHIFTIPVTCPHFGTALSRLFNCFSLTICGDLLS